jgi:DNA invertase Pin-like site-specific DNA recombinase
LERAALFASSSFFTQNSRPSGDAAPNPRLRQTTVVVSKAGSEAEAALVRGSLRAAQYVRMSTEHQKYSTANQADAIRRYADQRGIEIIRTYADEGKSGLTLKGRDGLRSLIADVFSGKAEFRIILVYDVSRWGRFQDVDEAAHLEYLCTSAGMKIHYCAEMFTNDGSIGATIVKSIKRAMAAEYSRELSVKIFAGQCRIASLGFHLGGPAPIGLRRILVDENRHVKGELLPGQYKNLQSDRVILAPGPPEEIATVRRIFRLFVKGKNESQIALLLNREGRLTHLGRPWLRGTVRKVLTNEKYIGNVVRNQTSFKLKKRRITNPPEMVLRTVGAFPAIIEKRLFERARKIIDERVRRLSDDEMLDQLKGLWKKAGTLSYRLINDTEGLHGGKHYAYRFGSLDRVYKRLGFKPTRDSPS